MASGVKQNETRSWRTSYRGDLVICSAKRKPSPEEVAALEIYEPTVAMPCGCALCIVEIYDCVPTALFHGPTPLKISQAESDLGDYTPGRFAWRTRNCRPLRPPVPTRGCQGLWTLDEHALAAIKASQPSC